jgi:glyoxylase-like metal-dependent hydrolase (beta-lactamase superfamily II)
MDSILIRSFTAPGFEENAYLIFRRGTGHALAVDPGAQADSMAAALAAENLTLDGIVLTHAHIDHVEGVGLLHEKTGAPIWLHPADKPLYDRAGDQAAMFGLSLRPLPSVQNALEHEQQLTLAEIELEVRHVPGHSPGHVILWIAAAHAAIVGDVIFHGSVGRTDLPGGNFPQLVRGIRRYVFTLPGDTTLWPGHGPPTTVAHEQATNPFLIPQYGGGLA